MQLVYKFWCKEKKKKTKAEQQIFEKKFSRLKSLIILLPNMPNMVWTAITSGKALWKKKKKK